MEGARSYPGLSVTHYGRYKHEIQTELDIRCKRCPGYDKPGPCVHYKQSDWQ